MALAQLLRIRMETDLATPATHVPWIHSTIRTPMASALTWTSVRSIPGTMKTAMGVVPIRTTALWTRIPIKLIPMGMDLATPVISAPLIRLTTRT